MKYSEVRCGTPSSTKLRNILQMQVCFMLIRIKKLFENRVQISKFKIFHGFDENSKFKKITFKLFLKILKHVFCNFFIWILWLCGFCGVVRKASFFFVYKRHAKHQLRLILYGMFARVVCVVCAGWWSDVCVLECSRKKEIFFLGAVQF